MNRSQRRAREKATPRWRRGTTMEDRERMLAKNGITVKDLRNAGDSAYRDGYDMGCREAVRMCYASFCLALHEIYGFGGLRARRALVEADRQLVACVDSEELIRQVEEKMGYQICFKEPIERVKEATKESE